MTQISLSIRMDSFTFRDGTTVTSDPSIKTLHLAYPDPTNIETGAHSVWQQPAPHRRQERRSGDYYLR